MLVVFFAKEPFERVQTTGPEALVKTQPLMSAGKWSRVQAAQMGTAAHFAADKSGVLKRFDMFRGSRERNSEGFRELAYRSLAQGEFAKHLSARGVAEGVKDGIQLRGF